MADHARPPGLTDVSSRERAPPERSRRITLAVCFGVPALVLLSSYVWLAIDHDTLLLGGVVVHETGRYTLVETILYHSHFLRELPVALAYALFVLAAAPAVGPVASPKMHDRGPLLAWAGPGVAAFLVTWSLLVASRETGWSEVWRDLLQFRTRDDVAAYGSHWHYHWLSTAWFGAAVPVATLIAQRLSGAVAVGGSRAMQTLAWGWFILLTMIFGLSMRTFTDVRYAGHQAREIMTHGPVTLLLAIGIILLFVGRSGRVGQSGTMERRRVPWIRLAIAFVIPAWLAAVALTGDVMAAGQNESGLAGMVAAHWFEHTLDYILVMLLVLGGLGLRAASVWTSSGKHAAGPALARRESRGW